MPSFDERLVLAKEVALKLLPTVITYSRLEPLNVTNGDLTPGLQALLGDPLWMIGRQWQFEELRGEDGGSPIRVEVQAEHGPVSRFHPGATGDHPDQVAVDVASTGTPLEVAVEAEAPPVLPERIRAHLGLQMLRLLRGAGLSAPLTRTVVAAVIKEWAFGAPPDADLDPVGADRRRLYTGRVPDGGAAADALRPRLTATGKLGSLPVPVRKASGGSTAAVRTALAAWLRWADGYLAGPVGASWDPRRQEYAFSLQATLSTGNVTLRADEYAGGTIDWHSVDASTTPGLGAPAVPVAPTVLNAHSIPVPVRYPGMPSDRLWAFEDAKVYLGGLSAGTPDLARLALVEFSLVFGNDWFMVPFDLPYGEVARVHSLRSTDTFGVTVDILPSRDVSRPGWTVFSNTDASDSSALADLFYLPATVPHALEGEPLEEVALFRDEMANLVWGVERVVQGSSGEPVRRGLRESRTLRRQIPGDLDDAAIIYRLMTPVPDHWVPFVSVPVPGRPVQSFATELERRPMVHFLDDGTIEVVHPLGVLLREDPTGDVTTDRLRIAEEEVPRDGIVVTRSYQLARTSGGGSVLWVGRRKRPGKGEGSSGLRYDTAVPPELSGS